MKRASGFTSQRTNGILSALGASATRSCLPTPLHRSRWRPKFRPCSTFGKSPVGSKGYSTFIFGHDFLRHLLEFPYKIEALDGYGFGVSPTPNGTDLFQISFNKGTNFLSLKAMREGVEGNLAVVLDGKVYSLFCTV